MSIDLVRHGRQIRLPEIGEAGQERLSASEAVLHTEGDAREIEASYLAGAGVRVGAEASVPASADGPESSRRAYAELLATLGLRDPAARSVADGALRALLTMREILGIEGTKGAQ
jgi:hypothetical protein